MLGRNKRKSKTAHTQDHHHDAHEHHDLQDDDLELNKHDIPDDIDDIDPDSMDPWDIFYYQHNRRLNY